MSLKTTYKDDVLDTAENTRRKYRIIENNDGTVSLEDATEYITLGDVFSGKDINKTNEEVNKNTSDISELNSKMESQYISNVDVLEKVRENIEIYGYESTFNLFFGENCTNAPKEFEWFALEYKNEKIIAHNASKIAISAYWHNGDTFSDWSYP